MSGRALDVLTHCSCSTSPRGDVGKPMLDTSDNLTSSAGDTSRRKRSNVPFGVRSQRLCGFGAQLSSALSLILISDEACAVCHVPSVGAL